jgi:hypothetical protein
MQIQRPTIVNFDAATSGTIKSFSILPTYNQATGTAANTDFFINRTETAIGSGAQFFIDLQVGSVSKYSVSNTGAVAALTFNGNTITTGTGTLTIAAGKTLTASNTLTFTGTDSSSVAFGTGGTVLYSGGALGTPSSGTLTNCTFPTLNQNTSGTAAGLSATLVIASGGTNGTASPTAGGSAYGTGTAYAFTAAGTAGHVLISNAASAPTWGAIDGGTF